MKASWKEVKEVKKVTSKFMFEVGRGWKAQGMACAKTNKKHASTIRVSCLGIWNKTLELEEVF